MKTKTTVSRYIALSALALGLTLAVPLSASAAPRDSGTCAEHGERGGPGMGMHHRGGFADLRGIDLSAEQVAALGKLREAEQKLMREKGQALRDQHDALHKLVMSDAYTPAAAAEIIAKISAAQSEMSKLHADGANKVYKLLTPEQRTKLAQNELVGGRHDGPGKHS